MSDNFSQAYGQMIDALQSAHDSISSIDDKETTAIKNRVLTNLKRDINALTITSSKSGSAGSVAPPLRRQNRPLKRLFGNDVVVKKVEEKPKMLTKSEFRSKNEQSAEEIAGKELKAKVDRLYPEFVNIKTDQIKDGYSDLEILGVAKRAELPVTEKTVVDLAFIEEVKKAITKIKERDEKKK